MKTQYLTATSLDGFIATEDDSLDWLFPLGNINDTSYPSFWVVGGGDLAGQFHDAGLLDEIVAQVSSVTLGAGKPLFPRRLTSPPLRLDSVRQVGTGFAELTYSVPK